MNLLDKLEEIICDIEGLSDLLQLAGVSVSDRYASTALIYAGRALEKLKPAVEEVEEATQKMIDTVKEATK